MADDLRIDIDEKQKCKPLLDDPIWKYRIPLSGKNGDGQYIIVDKDDYVKFNCFKWHLSDGYAKRRAGFNKNVYLHREIMGNPELQVDHINRDKLDCRKSNLRLATPREQSLNSKPKNGKYKGVHFYKSRGNWSAQIGVKGKNIFLGYFDNPLSAAKAYDQAAKEHFGEFAYLNFEGGL